MSFDIIKNISQTNTQSILGVINTELELDNYPAANYKEGTIIIQCSTNGDVRELFFIKNTPTPTWFGLNSLLKNDIQTIQTALNLGGDADNIINGLSELYQVFVNLPEDINLLTELNKKLAFGLFANIPTATLQNNGFYYQAETGLYKSNGSSWDLIGYNKADIDTLLNLKINTTDIIDNLTSTDINKPLSANQGKILKDTVDLKLIKAENLNDLDNKSTARVNLDVYSKGEVDSKDQDILNTRKGEEWYVANTGSDTTGLGSFLNPFATVNNAITSSNAADLIKMLAGTYTQDINFSDGKSRIIEGTGTDNATLLNGNVTFGTGTSLFSIINNLDIRGKVSTAGLGGWRINDSKILNSTGNAVEIGGALQNNIVFDRTQISQGNIVITSLSAQDVQIKNGWCPVELIINSGVVFLDSLVAIGKITLNGGILAVNNTNFLKDANDISLYINATAGSGSMIFLTGNNSLLQANQTYGKIVRADSSKNAPIYVTGILTDNPTSHQLYTTPITSLNHLAYFSTGYSPTNYSTVADIVSYHLAGIDAKLGILGNGTVSVSFTNQNTIAVDHNKGYNPLVQVINNDNKNIDVAIEHESSNRFVIYSNINITGKVIYF